MIRYFECDGTRIDVQRENGKPKTIKCYDVCGNNYEVQITHQKNGSRILKSDGVERLTGEVYLLAENGSDFKIKIGEIFIESEFNPGKFAKDLGFFVRDYQKTFLIDQRHKNKSRKILGYFHFSVCLF